MVCNSNDMFGHIYKRPESWSLAINVLGFYLRNTPSMIAAIFELGVLQNGIRAKVYRERARTRL